MSRPPSRLENLRNLQVANLDVAFATAFGTLVSGSFLVYFIQSLGGSDFWIGLVGAIPALMGLLQIPGAIWGRAYPFYKRFVSPGGWTWRLLYAPLIALPLVPLTGDTRLLILAVCIALATAAVQVVSPIYNDWIAEMVPENSRGWYFSRRTLIATAVGMVAGFAGAVVLDLFRDAGREAVGFAVIFGAGFVCAIVSMVFFERMKDMPRVDPVRGNLRESLRLMVKPVGDRNFRLVLIFVVIFTASQGYAGNFFTAFAREVLTMTFTQIQMLAVSAAIGTVVTVRFWGYLADKYGNKPVLTILTAGVVLTPVMWIFTYPGQPLQSTVLLTTLHFFNGALWSGVAVTQLNLFMSTARPEDRANYLGMVLAVQAVVLGVSPLLGAATMEVLRGMASAENAYKILFAAVVGIRVLALFALLPVREEGSTSIRGALRQLVKFSPRGARALKTLTASTDVGERAQAIAAVGESNFAMATGELVKALTDPSPRVRRQAALSLAKVADAGAVHDLIRHIEDNRELVEEETLEALGDLGSADAVPVLVSFLKDPRSLLRRTAARSLGQIGDPKAIPPLIEAARVPGDPDLRRAALQALRALEAEEASSVIGDALFDPHPSVRTAAAEAVGELGLRDLAQPLRQSLEWLQDEAGSELAYALGCVGDESDVPQILDAARLAFSTTTRRRCLLGVARLMGVEDELYRLMMLDGFSRDAALMQMMKDVYRKHRRLKNAVEKYSAGDEVGALALLLETERQPGLHVMRGYDVDELFLLAALAYAKGA